MKIEEGIPLARMTTVGIGGPARALARPRTLAELEEALAWAGEQGLDVRPIGLGSNLLAPDDGVDALVVRLEGELAAVEVRGTVLVAGGGAPNAVCLHRARAAGLGGFEFACAIPGTAGGGVRMNAGAYGSDWKAILVRALVVDATGTRWRTNEELDLSYRHSALVPGEVVAGVEFQLAARDAAEIKETVAAMQARRKDTQPTNKRTFGSVFKNPDHELGAGRMIELCGLKGHRIGGATISPRHANFIENAGGATAGEAIALMAEARARVLDRFGVVARARGGASRRARTALGARTTPVVTAGPRRSAAKRSWHGRAPVEPSSAVLERPPAPARRGGRARARRLGDRRILRRPTDGDLRPRSDPGHRCAAVHRRQDQGGSPQLRGREPRPLRPNRRRPPPGGRLGGRRRPVRP